MKCPSCGSQAPDAAAECPSCGVVFAKLKAIKEREKKSVETAELKPSAPPLDPAKLRAYALAFVIGWLVAFSIFFKREMDRVRPEPPPPFDETLRPPPSARSR